jgi:hypothetical protein
MANEEILVKMGLNMTAIHAGLKQVKHEVGEFAAETKSQFTDVMKELAAPLSAAGIVGGIQKAFGRVEEIERVSEATGLGAEEFQRMAYAAKSLGIESSQTEKSLEFLSKTIGEAANGGKGAMEIFDRWHISLKDANGETRETGKILNDISDALAATSSKTDRAAMAMDFLGKSGSKMIGILADGSKKLHERGAGAAVFTEQDIENIKQAHEQVEAVSNSIVVGIGKAISILSSGAQAWGEFFGEQMKDGWDKLARTDEDMVAKLKAHAEYVNKIISDAQAAERERIAASQAATIGLHPGESHEAVPQLGPPAPPAGWVSPGSQADLFRQHGYRPWTPDTHHAPGTSHPPEIHHAPRTEHAPHPFGQAHDIAQAFQTFHEFMGGTPGNPARHMSDEEAQQIFNAILRAITESGGLPVQVNVGQ